MLGCEGGGRNASNNVVRSDHDVVVTGSVGDGPVVGAAIEVVDADGSTVSQAIGGSSTFHALVPANTAYPIRLRAIGGTDLVTNRAPDFALETVLVRPDQVVANLSPFSTLVSRIAECAAMPPNQAKLAKIWDQVMSNHGMGYDLERFGHPAWTPMASGNAMPFVLASEAFGESIRRTQEALANSPEAFDIDAVLKALACDLTDGSLDGRGDGSSPRIAATFQVASAGVLLETVTKRLRVDGSDATARLDAAMQETGFGGGSVVDVDLNPLLMRQARDRLATLLGRVPGDLVARLLRLFDQTPTADLSQVIAANLSDTDLNAFTNVAHAVAIADDGVLETVLVSANPPSDPIPPVVSLGASPANIGVGETARVSWATVEAQACWATGAWAGEQPLEGSYTTSPLTIPKRYGLTCTGSGGTVSQEVNVEVAGTAPAAAPRVELSATPATVAPGESVTLAWTSSGATECAAGGSWSGNRLPQGSVVTGPLAAVSSFSLACVGPGGTASDVVGVLVRTSPVPEAVTSSIQASPRWVARGASATLNWSSKGATQCSASGAWNGSRPAAGTATVAPVALDSTFILTCSGPGGSVVSNATVSLRAARLSWRALDEQTSVAGLVGFRVFHGTTPGIYDPPITVTDTAVRELEMALAPGIHYFAVAAVTPSGSLGALSNEVSKTVE